MKSANILKYILIVIFLLPIIKIQSQTVKCTVSGTIIDAITKEPIKDLNIILRGTLIGTTTDPRGNYQLTFENDGECFLVFSHVLYNKKVVKIKTGWKQIDDMDFELSKANLFLEESTIIGQKTLAEKKAIADISAADLAKFKSTNMEDAFKYIFNNEFYNKEKGGEEHEKRDNIYKPYLERLRDQIFDDYTIYINDEYHFDSSILSEIDPGKVRRVLIWRRTLMDARVNRKDKLGAEPWYIKDEPWPRKYRNFENRAYVIAIFTE